MSGLDESRFDSVVRDAIDAAATRAGTGACMDTRDVLLALMRADTKGEWDRIALHFASEEAVRGASVTEPRPEAAYQWGSTLLSHTCGAALMRAMALADLYGTHLVPLGLTVIALVAEPGTAAAKSLTGGDGGRHPQLLRLLQEAILGGALGGLDTALRQTAGVGMILVDGVRETRAASDRVNGGYEDVVDALGGSDSLAEADALALLYAALPLASDGELGARYQRMRLDAEDLKLVRPMVSGYATMSAATVVQRAQERFDTKRPDARQIVVAATLNPCDQVARALWLLGLTPKNVAFEAAVVDAQAQRIGGEVTETMTAYTALTALLSVVTTLFIVRHLFATQDWWPGIPVAVVLCWVTWTGNLFGDVVLTGVLWFWADPVTAAVALAMTAAGLLLTRSEIQNALKRTGIAMTRTQWRRHLRIRYPRQSRPVSTTIEMRRQARLTRFGEGER